MKVLPIVVGAFGMVPKGQEKWLGGGMEIWGRIEIIQLTELLRSTWILRCVNDLMAQSAGDAEYTDCISAEE